jgi:hypothetical protein
VIKIPCIAECDECETTAPMEIEVKGECEIGKQRALMIGGINLPDGWEEFREDYYYGQYDDKIICPKCLPDKKK